MLYAKVRRDSEFSKRFFRNLERRGQLSFRQERQEF